MLAVLTPAPQSPARLLLRLAQLALVLAPTSRLLAVDYVKDIKPLLTAHCYTCHGALKQKAGLRLDTVASMRNGGDDGSILKAGHSLLLERVTTTDKDDRMPPEGEGPLLKADEIALLKAWIAAGATGPANEAPEPDPRAHWAYQVPKSSGRSLDAMLAARFAARQLKPQPEAAPELWLRRVYLDLIGLPPSPEQIMDFARNTSPPARQRVVDHLLASPQYGERWARHFMDIWRYCDWYGLGEQLRYSQKHIWHWRDWIVESLNADKGYDRMVVQMLAADEAAPEDRDNLRATGFLARSYFLFNRTTWLDDTIEHTSRALLGVTMQCVKCHAHKYDPIEQADYYHMRAIFEPLHVRLDPWQGEPDLEKNGLPRVFDLHLDKPTYRHVRGDEKNEDKSKPMSPGVPGVLSFAAFQPVAVKLPTTSSQPGLLPFVLGDQLRTAERGIAAAQHTVDEARKALHEVKPAQTPSKANGSSLVVQDDFKEAKPNLWQTVSGDWHHTGGGLRQSETGAARRILKLKPAPPADFDATLSFTIRGGEKWKSVGLVFDSQDRSDTLVYMSAFSGGSKLQVALTTHGKATYPGAGAVAYQVLADTRYSLNLRLRGQLLNVSIDDKPALAYRLPQPRTPGAMSIAAFDADVAFHGFKLAELPAEAPLREPGKGSPVAMPDAKDALALAEEQLAAAKARPAMIRAIFAADQKKPDKNLARTAAAAEAVYKLEQAQVEVFKAGHGTSAKDPAKALKSAREALDKAQKKAASPGEAYTSLPASLKAQEGPTEADNASVQTYPVTSTGRRLAFARWVTDQRNPLTARVLVNHVWLRHFGASLVPDVGDFGRRCPPPLHQDVLDTLAADFMANGWSLKHLHRTLVLSDLYARSSSNAGADPATMAADPDNATYWRMNPRRMESQVVRDTLLQLAGKLDLTLGGPSIDPGKSESSPRRSLYFQQNADVEHRFLATFDNSNVLECYRRNESVVPQQALALANSKLSSDCAEAMAARMTRLTDDAFLHQAFLAVLGRPPNEAERRASSEGFAFLNRKRSLFLQALMNHNDFVTLR